MHMSRTHLAQNALGAQIPGCGVGPDAERRQERGRMATKERQSDASGREKHMFM